MIDESLVIKLYEVLKIINIARGEYRELIFSVFKIVFSHLVSKGF